MSLSFTGNKINPETLGALWGVHPTPKLLDWFALIAKLIQKEILFD
jgi:hypothetical protein